MRTFLDVIIALVVIGVLGTVLGMVFSAVGPWVAGYGIAILTAGALIYLVKSLTPRW